ncbi:MAG: hypothetical protein JST64_11090, partial [Actinobacteria bacterium]|nr:hypothetical protein [Actinomycetota bacterium]
MSSASADDPHRPDRPATGTGPPTDAAALGTAALPPVASATSTLAGREVGDVGAVRRDGGASAWDRPPWAAITADESGVPASRRRPRRRGRFVVIGLTAVAVALVALVAAEALGRWIVTDQVATRLRSSGITGDVDVSLGARWRPVVLPALLGAGIDHLSVRIVGGEVSGLPVRRADYELRGLDADVSVRHGTVHVRSIDAGDVRIEIDPSALEPITGTPMRVRGGHLVAGPDALVVHLAVRGDALVLDGP